MAEGILRRSNGRFISSFFAYLGTFGTNSLAEVSDILLGIKAVEQRFSNFLVQCDSLMLISVLNNKPKTPWKLDLIIQEIRGWA